MPWPKERDFVVTVYDRRNNQSASSAGGAGDDVVKAVNRPSERDAYAVRQKVYPKLAHGKFRTTKWAVMIVTLTIYYALPWLKWNRGPDLPDQAVLLDMAHNRFFFFFLEIWPQEFYYVTGLLVLASLILFLATSVAGRVWCGYTCPQTVWTDLMVTVERFWQGDRNARIRLDKEPWGLKKIVLKLMTHLSWLAIGLATGGALVFYFDEAPKLLRGLLTGTAPAVAYLFMGIFTFMTYLLGGIAREQVCIYMCPWPRIQGAMTDQHTLLVSYRAERGEPRGPHKKGQSWEGHGDCIDCNACVAVCPTGIDIRDGSQLECIQCALCIDACNGIMDRIERPRGLIAYDTVARKEATASGVKHEALQLIRPRTVLYASMLALVGAVMLGAWLQRTVVEVNVLADRNPPFVKLTNGNVRNGYTVKVLNKQHERHDFEITVRDQPGAVLTIVGQEDQKSSKVNVPTDELREFRIYVTLLQPPAAGAPSGVQPLTFVVRDLATGVTAVRLTQFRSGVP